VWRVVGRQQVGYAVRHYFLNGGEQAVICRVVDQISTTTATLDYNGDGGLVLAAADPGAWANNLSVTVDVGTPGTVLATDEVDPVVEAADGYEPAVSTRESHPNVSIDPNSSRYVVTRLAQHSALARIQAATAMPNTSRDAGLLPAAAPVVTFRDGSDGLADDVVPADVEGPIDRLGDADIVNLVCVPPLDRNTETATETWAYALRWAEAHRAIPLVDPPTTWTTGRTRRSCAKDSRRSGARMSRSTFRGWRRPTRYARTWRAPSCRAGGGRAYRPHRPDPRGLESASRHRHGIVRGQRPRVRAH
jgi:hypothetical protein